MFRKKTQKKCLKIGWSLKILHQLISGKHKVNIPVGFNMFCFSQGGARISYPSTVYYICQGGKNQKPWPPTSSINWVHWIPYGNKIWSGLSYMAQKTGHQIHPNPMMCPHDARLRWRLDLTCGSHVKYDPWGFKYGSHPTKILKMLKSQKIPIHSYSILFINGRIHGLPCGHWLSRLVSLVSAGWFSLGTSTPWYLGQNRNLGGRQLLKKKNIYGWFTN